MILGATVIDKKDSMYPSAAYKLESGEIGDLGYWYSSPISHTYGYVMSGVAVLPREEGEMRVYAGEFFSFWSLEPKRIDYEGKVVVFTRHGYKGLNMIGGPIEEKGRLAYIDGCSDTILVPPARLGDPSLNQLYFPRNIEQTFHTHPSIRIGCVVAGAGYASLKDGELPLNTGDMFCLEEHEHHRFRTDGNSMTIIVYHPDGDWGPTDHNHIMLNRTYLTK
jgi:hypothetical protein